MNLEEFKRRFQELAEKDREIKETYITAPTLQLALEQASIELGLPLKDISYEIHQKSRKGFLKQASRACTIIAYESDEARLRNHAQDEANVMGSEFEEAAKAVSVDGKVSIRCYDGTIFVTVSPPKGEGIEADYSQIKTLIKKRDLTVDEKLINMALDEKAEEMIVVGTYKSTSYAINADVSIHVSDDNMLGYVTLLEPTPGGSDMSENTLRQELEALGVTHGILDEELYDLVTFPVYGKEILIAKGEKEYNGEDAKIEYMFETNPLKLAPKEIDGKIDYKETSIIQNITAGQTLAKKILPEKGVDGFTVYGSMRLSKDGKDISLKAGDHTHLTDDGMEIIADIDGQVHLQGDGKIFVSPVYTVYGNVNNKSGGNINFVGSVVVNGIVESGFDVKATKDVIISGASGKNFIESAGDITVKQGITGNTEDNGLVKCDGNLNARFILNANVVCKGSVIIRDEVLNSHIDSHDEIICLDGRKAVIRGGRYRASKKIVAKSIGGSAGVETILEVGVDPEKRTRYEELDRLIHHNKKELDEIVLNLNSFKTSISTGSKVSKERFENLKLLKVRKDELTSTLEELAKEFGEIKEYLNSLKNEGTVSVEGILYPGVRIIIADAEFRVRNEMRYMTFYKEGPMIKTKEFMEKRNAR